jgi:hypothetical protein
VRILAEAYETIEGSALRCAERKLTLPWSGIKAIVEQGGRQMPSPFFAWAGDRESMQTAYFLKISGNA